MEETERIGDAVMRPLNPPSSLSLALNSAHRHFVYLVISLGLVEVDPPQQRVQLGNVGQPALGPAVDHGLSAHAGQTQAGEGIETVGGQLPAGYLSLEVAIAELGPRLDTQPALPAEGLGDAHAPEVPSRVQSLLLAAQ